MQMYRYDTNSIVINCNHTNNISIINLLNYFSKEDTIYLYGNNELEKISENYLNVVYLNDIKEIKKYKKISKKLSQFNQKIESLLLLQEYELLNTETYIIYEVCNLLEETQKNKLNVNKMKYKIIKYLESRNKKEISNKVIKIKAYD